MNASAVASRCRCERTRPAAGPQAISAETGDLAKSVETAVMRIAGHVIEFFELSEDSEIDVGAEGTFQIGQRCDFVVEQQLS